MEYNFSYHSNDIINLNLISHIITEKGEIASIDVASVREKLLIEN